MNLLAFASRAGLSPKWAASTHGGEYKSSCPSCGGNDRFFMQPNRPQRNCSGYYRCRQCGTNGDTIQFGRQFLGLTFAEALQSLGSNLNNGWRYQRVNKLKQARPETVKLGTLPIEWIKRAKNFVDWGHDQIWHYPDILNCLAKRGLPDEAIKRYKIGLNHTDIFRNRSSWGLEESSGKSLWLPKGIIIPTIEPSNKVIRIKIRRNDWYKDDDLPKYVALSGSLGGLNIVNMENAANCKLMVVVESELDAYAIAYAAGAFVLAVAVGSFAKNPDLVTDYCAKQKKLLICHDNDDAGSKMLMKWQKLYKHAQAFNVPIGKDIGEAIEQGLDVRKWLLEV